MKTKFLSLFLISILAAAYGVIALEEVATYQDSLDVNKGESLNIGDENNNDPFCGNGIIDRGEQCDGNNLNGKSCSGLLGGDYTGSLSCSNCVFVTSQCSLAGANQNSNVGGQTNGGGGGGGGSGGGSTIVVPSTKTGNITCVENWECSEWGVCLKGEQSRICTDKNNCGTGLLKPVIDRICENKLLVNGDDNKGIVGRLLGAVIGLGSNPANLSVAAAFLVTVLVAMLVVRTVKKKKAQLEAGGN